MKIYVVVDDLGPEGDYIHGVFFDRTKAIRRADEERADGLNIVIREYETDDEPVAQPCTTR